MKVSVREQKPPGRKPVQLGMMMACGALLEVQEFLLEGLQFLFVLLGLVTQDCIENLNSLLRYLQPTPYALHIKQNLKVITLTQMCLTAKNTNYNIDEVVDDNSAPPEEKLDFLAYTRKVAAAKKAEKDVEVLMESAAFHVPEVTDFEVDIFDPYQKYRLYDIAGSVLHSLKSMNITTCDGCFEALLWRGPGSHRFATIVSLREYKKGCLYSVSDECFLVIVKAKITFRKTRDELKSVKHINAVKFLVEKLQYAWEGTF